MTDMENQKGRRSSINVAGITARDDLFLGEDPELVQLVVEKMKNMDKDGDGRVDGSELAVQMMDAVKSALKVKKKTKHMKYAIAALCGLLCMMAATGLLTAYAAAKLAQEVKVSSDGVLVKADGVTPVETTVRSTKFDLASANPRTDENRRDLQEGMIPAMPDCDALVTDTTTLTLCDATLNCQTLDTTATMLLCLQVVGCITAAQLAAFHTMSQTTPVTIGMNTTLGTVEASIQVTEWSEDLLAEGVHVNITTTTGTNYVIQSDPVCDAAMFSFNQLFSASTA